MHIVLYEVIYEYNEFNVAFNILNSWYHTAPTLVFGQGTALEYIKAGWVLH